MEAVLTTLWITAPVLLLVNLWLSHYHGQRLADALAQFAHTDRNAPALTLSMSELTGALRPINLRRYGLVHASVVTQLSLSEWLLTNLAACVGWRLDGWASRLERARHAALRELVLQADTADLIVDLRLETRRYGGWRQLSWPVIETFAYGTLVAFRR